MKLQSADAGRVPVSRRRIAGCDNLMRIASVEVTSPAVGGVGYRWAKSSSGYAGWADVVRQDACDSPPGDANGEDLKPSFSKVEQQCFVRLLEVLPKHAGARTETATDAQTT